ncbi:MAG: flavin reductase family protein [Clostridia bacterium]|nr:flavin reductase family protein [Clostridia bacterium]
MSKIVLKGDVMLAPVPAVLVTSSFQGKNNVMTVAWTGVLNSVPPKTYVSVRKSRYSHELISKSGEFVINLPNRDLLKATDFCGIISGKAVDKFEKCGLLIEKGSVVSAPVISQAPLALECKVTDVIELGSHDMFVADIVSVVADEGIIDKNGRADLSKADIIAYVQGKYYSLGENLGRFGFSVEKKK